MTSPSIGRKRIVKRQFRLVACLLGCLLQIPQTALADTLQFTVGVVPQFDAREMFRIWTPILREVSTRSGVLLKLAPSTTIPEFERNFGDGQFHFAYLNPYHSLVAYDKQGYEPILRDTSRQLKGIIVVRKDSPLADVKQLDGKSVAMPAPNALGAALLPRAEFATIHHIKPEFRYVRSHSSVYLNVAVGQTDAGGGVMASLNKQPAAVRERLRILYTTQGLEPHPVVAHPTVPAAVVKRVQAAFLALGQTEEGKTMLSRIPIKRIGKSTLQDYAALRELNLGNFYVTEK